MIKNTPKRIQFTGGANKVTERALLNGLSDKNNFRNKIGGGIISRGGQARHHTATDLAQEIYNLFQYIDKGGNKKLYAQRADGSVHLATDSPPATTTGNFGAEALAAIADTKAASASILDGNLLYSDGKRGHYAYPGASQLVKGFHVYKGTAAIPVIPEIGEDYTNEVTDSSTSRVAVLNSLNTLANYNFFLVITELPANSITLTMVNANGTAATLAGQYWKSDGTWAEMSGLTDGTALAGATLGQSGAIAWTHPSDEIPHYQFGRSGYCYRFNVSAAIDSTVSVSQAVYTGAWNALVNVWDGTPAPAIEAQVYRVNNLKYEKYGGSSINISDLFDGSGDYVHFTTFDNICGFYIDTGNTPNIIKATITGSSDISFVDGGTGDDYITWQQARFQSEGFEEGQSIVITNTTSNNITVKAKQVTSNKIYVNSGLLTAEVNKSATLTYDNTGGTFTLEVWTGAGWTAISTNLSDDTATASKSGWVTFPRPTTAQMTQFNGSPAFAYCFRFKFNKTTSRNAVISIMTMPFFDITDWGNGYCNGTWRGRPILAQDKYPQWIEIGTSYRMNCFNGLDYKPFEVGDDGRDNRVLAFVNFFQDLMVFQEEKGLEGGCITMIQGYDTQTIEKSIISNSLGIVNSKAYAVVDGVPTPKNPKASHAKMVFFISREGVYMTDGQGVMRISDPMGLYFDTTDTASCIRRGYEDKHWLNYDKLHKSIRIGLCTGTSATVANVWLVYHIDTGTWGTDTLGQAITCMANVESASGNLPVLQYGGASDGFIYRLNTGTNDVGAVPIAVNAYVTVEIDGEGHKIDARTLQLRCKAQSAGSITPSLAFNGNTTYQDETVRSMTVVTANDTYRVNDFPINRKLTDHISIKLSHNTAGEEVYLLDMALLDAEGKNVFKN